MPSDDLFNQEQQVIADASEWLESVSDNSEAENLKEFDKLLKEYRKLYKTTRRLMLLSDRNELELRRLRTTAETAKSTLSRYFSPNLTDELLENPDFLGVGGERRELTFLFTDLADFTALVERHKPSVVGPLLNEYLDSMTKIVYRHGGTTDKIVGDALHVMFGAPVDQADQAKRAIACALEIDAFSEDFRQQKKAQGIALGMTRIGLHSGQAVVGNFGGELFYNYTAYGDAVNTVARLESANKQLGTRVCASAAVIDQLDRPDCRPIGTLFVKGKKQGLDVFEPLTPEQKQDPSIAAYCDAFIKLERNDTGARQAFAAIVARYGEDPLAIFHLVRLLAGETGVEIFLAEK